MNAADWKKVDQLLDSVFSPPVHLRIDGYEVSLVLRQVSKFKNAIFLYINGVFRGEWIAKDCEERRRFFPCKRKSILKDSDFKKMGIRGKKQKEKLKEQYTYDVYSTGWTNFGAMKKHFEANNKSIELIGGNDEL